MIGRRLLIALAMAVLALCGWSAPALAAGELGLGTDGVHFASTLPAPLFDPAFRWVPGDSETATFYVRNQAKNAGALDITMLAPAVHDLIDSGDLTVSAKFENKPFVSVTTAGAHTLVDSVTVPPKGIRKITIRVDFKPTSPNATQDKVLDLRFKVTLSQRGADVSGPQTGGGNGHGNGGVSAPGSLPSTGNDVSPLTIILGALLCAAGAGLALFGQRREARKEGEPSHA